jgi:uncharacterized protein YecE (DUF72 family)
VSQKWYERTSPDFIFSAKVPQVVTHEKVLVNCEAEFNEFIDQMKLLREKLGRCCCNSLGSTKLRPHRHYF